LQRVAEACTSTHEKWVVCLTGSPAGPKGQTVDFTRTRKKYHRDGCRYLHPVVWKIPETGLGIDDLQCSQQILHH
jgi:hypothetical protein